MAKEGDLRILETVLRAIATGKYEGLKRSEELFRSLHARLAGARGPVDGDDELDLLLKNDPRLLTEATRATVEEALAFVREELERAGEIKKERPFTEEEKRFARERLAPLLSRVSDLLERLEG